VLLALGGALALPASALERADLRLHLGFEGSLVPQVGPATVAIAVQNGQASDVCYVAGRRGLAVQLAPGRGISFNGRDLFAAHEGTASLWVRPLGWRGGDGLNHCFLQASSDCTSFLLYKFYPGNTWVYLTGAGRTGVVGGWWDSWKEEQWTFLAFTFRPGEQAWYIDGKLQTRRTEDLIEPDFTKAAGVQLLEGNQVLDEIMVFSRALTEPEVEAVYRANRP
jgi:hypothetical protein